MPIIMSVPIMDSTLTEVSVTCSNEDGADPAEGDSDKDDQGIDHRAEQSHHDEIDQQHGQGKREGEVTEGLPHVGHFALSRRVTSFGELIVASTCSISLSDVDRDHCRRV